MHGDGVDSWWHESRETLRPPASRQSSERGRAVALFLLRVDEERVCGTS
jgi:hypothetical protein